VQTRDRGRLEREEIHGSEVMLDSGEMLAWQRGDVRWFRSPEACSQLGVSLLRKSRCDMFGGYSRRAI
jgi:hypothetical protein